LEKFAAVQMIDVHLPTTHGRELLLTRYTEPDPELSLLQEAETGAARPTTTQNHRTHPRHPPRCSADLRGSTQQFHKLRSLKRLESAKLG
jgi:hypothetical protein